MQEPLFDLFGEIRVTTKDVDAWVRAVPRLQPGTARAARYVEAWGVVEKIKRAKLEGWFDEVTSCRRQPSPAADFIERFSWIVKPPEA